MSYTKNNLLTKEDTSNGFCIYCGEAARKTCGSSRDTMHDTYYYCDCKTSKVVVDLEDKAQPLRDSLYRVNYQLKLLRSGAKELLDIKSKASELQKLLNKRKLTNKNLDEIVNL